MKKGIPDIPRWLLDQLDFRTVRNFKRDRRESLKIARKCLDDIAQGCHYTPFERQLSDARQALDDAIELASVKNWGR